MSGRLVVKIRDNFPEDWPPLMRFLGMTISSYFNEDKGYAFPGVPLLVKVTKLDKGNIYRMLRDDRMKAWIEHEKGGRGGREKGGSGKRSRFYFCRSSGNLPR